MIAVLTAITTIYWVAGAMAILLQARRIAARHSSADVSLRFMALYVGGYAIGLMYGMAIGNVALVVSSAVGFLCGAFTLALVLRYHVARSDA